MAKGIDSITAPKTKKQAAVKEQPVTDFNVEKNSDDKKDLIDKRPVKPKKETVNKEKRFTKKHKLIVGASVGVSILIFILGSLAAGAYAHNSIYLNKVFPGVVVWGEDVGGKSFDEVNQIINNKVINTKIKLIGPDQEYEAKVSDLGILVDTETMALSAYSKGRTSSDYQNYLTRARLLVTSINIEPLNKVIRGDDLEIEPSYTVNDQILDGYLNKVSENINISAKDSKVTVENGTVNVVPAVFGREVEKEVLKLQILENIKDFRSAQLTIKTKELRPAVIDKAAEEVKVQAESIISRPVILTFEGKDYKPNKETVSSWISFTKKEGQETYSLFVDPLKMKNYFAFLGTKVNIYPVPKKIRVENGAKETVIQEGKNGMLIDEKLLGKKIADALPLQPSVTLTIPTYVATFKTQYERVLVADWEKYIDINLSTQTMTAYLKGGQVIGSWKVTTGKSSTPTPVGTWLVHGKSAITRMTGGTRGIDYYDLPNVHWVTWFKGGGYSIHEAYWRTTFGGADYIWNGSHGCVNATLTVAKFIYDWAPVGTPVVVHY